MFSSVLGIIAGIIILADYFGYKDFGGIGYIACWFVVVSEALSRVGINLYRKDIE